MADSQTHLPEFQRQQYAFTAHLRDPEQAKAPSAIEDRRMAIYRELLFNNVREFIDDGFPVLKSLYTDTQWERLARSFFANYRAQSPYFVDISKGFVDYLQQGYTLADDDYPFLAELAHYEWVELALLTSDEEVDMDGIDRRGSLLEQTPVLSPLAHCLAYQWPVHTIQAAQIPTSALEQPVFIIVYRNQDEDVKFIEANPVTAHLFELLNNEPSQNGQTLLEGIAEQLQHPDPAIVIQGGLQTLTRWHHLGVVLGVR